VYMLPLFEMHFEHILKYGKIQHKMLHVYLHILCANEVVSAKFNLLCSLCTKKINFGAKIMNFSSHFLSFLHKAQKMSIFGGTLHVHIEYIYTCTCQIFL
jgi:hypothetical protein